MKVGTGGRKPGFLSAGAQQVQQTQRLRRAGGWFFGFLPLRRTSQGASTRISQGALGPNFGFHVRGSAHLCDVPHQRSHRHLAVLSKKTPIPNL